MRKLTPDQAVRLALSAQGLHDPRPGSGVDVRHFRRAMRKMGLLQLDSVNVLERSHYLPMFSRLGPYDRGRFDDWTQRSGELFEYWGHEASLLPAADFPLFRWRMETMRMWGSVRRLREERPGFIEKVRDDVAARGPLLVGDLVESGERTGPWWGYAPGKVALEWLFARGEITAYRNRTFARVYDLVHRVLDRDHVDAEAPDRDDAYRVLLARAARLHGVGTVSDLADYYRLHVPTARRILADMERRGEVEPVEIPGWKGPVYMDPEATMPRRRRGTALLSPFDPLVWHRGRTERLFGFRYRIEIYVPAPKRVFGYYVLPFLHEGRLVARVDLKADRANGRLIVRGAYAEPSVEVAHVTAPLAEELRAMGTWLGLGEVAVERRGNAAHGLRAEF